MEEKRKKFLETFAVQVQGLSTKKFIEENESKRTSIGEHIDGYKKYILDLGDGFIQFAEVYNQCIEIAKDNEVIGNTGLKVRIKDFSSASSNTEHKLLDDVFGMQISAKTEADKEFLILFNYLIFEIQKNKKYDKPNGYAAYHHIGDLSIKSTEEIKELIKQIIETSETREYKRAKHNPTYDKEKMVKVFKYLPKEIDSKAKFNRIADTLQEMLQLMQYAELEPSQIPLIEFHFMTSDAEEKAIRGTASHSKYKSGQTKVVRQMFRDGRLFRGINSPWKFEGRPKGLVLQNFYTTILENWPFLVNDIVERRKEGKESSDIVKNAEFDILLASQFPFLRKYLKNNPENYPDDKQDEKWGALKTIMIANKIDFNNKVDTIEDALVKNIGKIWK